MVFWLQSIEFQALLVFPVILVELRVFWHVGVHCNLLFVIIDMKDKCAIALPISFYYKKRRRLQQV